MALSSELVHRLIAHRGNNIEVITHILNEYNRKQIPYNQLNGEDILNAYKLTGIYCNPINIIHGKVHDDKIGLYRFGNHI